MNSIPSSLRPAELARELEGQMLRWGRDVTSPHGNLLERHGFLRFRTPDHDGSSRYRLHWRDRLIELHSSCITFCGGGRPGLRYVWSRKRVYLWLDREPFAPGSGSDAALILPFHPGELDSFRLAAAELRQWLEAYAAWRARVPSNLVMESTGKPSVSRWFGVFRRWWRPAFSWCPLLANRAPNVRGQQTVLITLPSS